LTVRDRDVRAALHALLRSEHAHELADTRILNELSLCGTARVDVAVMNGELAGYELKSERDTLRRLPQQVEVYSQVLDRATLVVADQHLEHGLESVPEWWGLIVASFEFGETHLVRLRPPLLNVNVCPERLVQLLWRDETLEELESRGLARGVRSASRRALAERLATTVPLEELRAMVRERLKRREAWRAESSPL
jgi:hypothetical protein